MELFKKKFPLIKQLDSQDCGPSCIRMVARHYGKHFSQELLSQKCSMFKEGVTLVNLSAMAEEIGFRTLYVKVSFEKMMEKAPLPAVVHWNQEHFVVVYKIKKNRVYV